MFGWEYPPTHLGGLGVACQGLVNGLLQNGVRVTLVLPHPNQSEQDGLDILHPTDSSWHDAMQTMRVRSDLQPYDDLKSFGQRTLKHVPRDIGQMYGDHLHEAIATFTDLSVSMTKHVNPNVIHCHDWMTYGAGIRAAVYHRRPFVAHIHATELDRTHFSPYQWIYDREREGFEAADHIIAVSNYTKNMLMNQYGIPGDKISVVHNATADIHDADAIRLRSEAQPKRAPLVLFLGRLAIQKGGWQFLEMAAQVHHLRPDVQFVIAGDGHLMGELIERSIALGLRDCVMFAGAVNSNEAKRLYAQADCFVMPSLSEPFGLVALEAIAQGTPVILSRQSGAAEVVKHGFAIDFWDTAKMADCVLTILRDEPLVRQLRTYAPSVLSSLTWKNQAAKVLSIYHSLLS